jgi:tetratricopeptide (TPR) repeat protein
MLWVNKWIQRFPQADMLYAFRWWLYNIRKDQPEAEKDLKISISMNPRNAVALYNMWLVEIEKGNLPDAKKYFESVIEADKKWTFGEKAVLQIKEVARKIKEAQTLTQSWTTLPTQ